MDASHSPFFWNLMFQCSWVPQPDDLSSVCFPGGKQVWSEVGTILRGPAILLAPVVHLPPPSESIKHWFRCYYEGIFSILICSKPVDLKRGRLPSWAWPNCMNSLDLGLEVRLEAWEGFNTREIFFCWLWMGTCGKEHRQPLGAENGLQLIDSQQGNSDFSPTVTRNWILPQPSRLRIPTAASQYCDFSL